MPQPACNSPSNLHLLSERLLEICSAEETAAICYHEVEHLTEGKATMAGRVLGSLYIFPLLFFTPVFHAWGPGVLLLPVLVWLLARFSRRHSLRLENRADSAALASQAEEGAYARALEKLYRENQLPAVNINDRQTHPHLYDRLLAAGVTPGLCAA
jgi:Zn-dependent protease with chaperone function